MHLTYGGHGMYEKLAKGGYMPFVYYPAHIKIAIELFRLDRSNMNLDHLLRHIIPAPDFVKKLVILLHRSNPVCPGPMTRQESS
uniref:Uncharacterized protein n=1 Tax=Pararge aegeria TaxID=116150 RepID=S4NVW0_9NEOP